MIYWELFLGFFEVGCFSFGGAYSSIPLIRDVVLAYGWLNDDMITYMIAVSESTPGPIMVNLATYVGSNQAGLIGAAIATFAVVLPAFIIILLITALLKTALENKYIQSVLNGLIPCIIGIILATACYMIINNVVTITTGITFNIQAIIISAILISISFGSRTLRKKSISPIFLIIISAFLGIMVF
ncbi:MAG TPA: chromate transporter [Clostridiaceae bacterium]|nr:chromate transporter [Clostridiaceae bacterium]